MWGQEICICGPDIILRGRELELVVSQALEMVLYVEHVSEGAGVGDDDFVKVGGDAVRACFVYDLDEPP